MLSSRITSLLFSTKAALSQSADTDGRTWDLKITGLIVCGDHAWKNLYHFECCCQRNGPCWNQILVGVKFRAVDIHDFANIKSNECVRPVG